jgi:MFS family permease
VFGLSALLSGWDDGALNIALPEIKDTFKLSTVELSEISSTVTVVTLVLGLPLGFLIDRVKRVRLVQIGEVAGHVGDVVQALAPNAGILLLGQAFGSLVRQPDSTAQVPLLSDYFPPHSRTRVFSFRAALSAIGGAISLPIVGVIVTNYGWRYATLVLAGASLVVAALTFLLKEPARGAADRQGAGQDNSTPADPAHQSSRPPSFREAIKAVWGIRTLRFQALASFALILALGPIGILLPLIMANRFGLNPTERSLISLGGLLVTLAVFPLSATAADRFVFCRPTSLAKLQIGLLATGVVALLLIAGAPTVLAFAIPYMILSAVLAVLTPLGFSLITLVVPARHRGVGFAISTPLQLLAVVLMPVIVGLAANLSLQQGVLFLAPILVFGGLTLLATIRTIPGDIERAKAVTLGPTQPGGAPEGPTP